MAPGSYILDGSTELGRLRINHQLYKDSAAGRLIWAPLDFSEGERNLLDVAGADGTFLQDVIQQYSHISSSTLAITTDITVEYFPRSCDSGFEFVEHDTNQPFPHDWEQRFDLVHQRLGFAGTGPRGLEVTKEFYRMTKPDGWVQLAELVIDPAVASGAAVKEFFLLMQATFAQLGQEPLFATEKLHLWVADAGFVDIQETTVTSYRGRLNENLEMAKASIESDVVGMQGLLHFINSLEHKPELLAAVDLDTLQERYVEELQSQGAAFQLRVVWGRRPASRF